MNDKILQILNNINNKYKYSYAQDIVSSDDLKLLADYIMDLHSYNDTLKNINDELLKLCYIFLNKER